MIREQRLSKDIIGKYVDASMYKLHGNFRFFDNEDLIEIVNISDNSNVILNVLTSMCDEVGKSHRMEFQLSISNQKGKVLTFVSSEEKVKLIRAVRDITGSILASDFMIRNPGYKFGSDEDYEMRFKKFVCDLPSNIFSLPKQGYGGSMIHTLKTSFDEEFIKKHGEEVKNVYLFCINELDTTEQQPNQQENQAYTLH